jgi:hypothetical protein
MKKILYSDYFLFFVISALAYLPFAPRFGYFNDDWYHMPTIGAQGVMYFNAIFSIDRPMRALVMIPAYTLFGNNPLYYNIAAYIFRLVSGLAFLWIVRQAWKDQRWATFSAALLFLTYPGFLVQPNAIDYLSHIFGLAAGMSSIALTIKIIQIENWHTQIALYLCSVLLGVVYLGQMEWYVGLEVLRFGIIFLFALRRAESLQVKMIAFIKWSLPAAASPALFLIWRLLFFKSERGATDVDVQLIEFRAAPFDFLLNHAGTLWDDILDVFFRAWKTPLQRLTVNFTNNDWLSAFGIAALVLVSMWVVFEIRQKHEPDLQAKGMKHEALLIGLGLLILGLLPVILVGRSVDFKSFSRYTIIASVGAALIWMAIFAFIPNLRARNLILSVFILSATLTHYANGLAHAKSTQATNNFWWQVSWRVPQFERGTTLVTSYSVIAEEDYFTWGPANLIYYPGISAHTDYHQPVIYAALLSEDTIEKVKAFESQEFSNRRGIRTYKNYRNILVLTQPAPDACMRVIDMNQIELSSKDDPRVVELAPYSEAEHVFYDDPAHTPPFIPFGKEPAHTWCYYYEKADLARQMGNWDEVIRLGDEVTQLGYTATDSVEWIPFLQAYARADNSQRVGEIAARLDGQTKLRACEILGAESLSPAMMKQIKMLCSVK